MERRGEGGGGLEEETSKESGKIPLLLRTKSWTLWRPSPPSLSSSIFSQSPGPPFSLHFSLLLFPRMSGQDSEAKDRKEGEKGGASKA